MNEDELSRITDFQSIAVEEMEKGNYEVAQEFAEDVLEMLQDEVA